MYIVNATITNKYPTKSDKFVYHLLDENHNCHRAFSTKEYNLGDVVPITEINFRTYILAKGETK